MAGSDIDREGVVVQERFLALARPCAAAERHLVKEGDRLLDGGGEKL